MIDKKDILFYKSSLKDIAKHAEVSITTASAVLSGKALQYRISEKTSKKVIDVAKSLKYVKNANAMALKSGVSGLIALIIPDLLHKGFANFANYLEQICHKNGKQLIVTCTNDSKEKELSIINHMLSHRVFGVIAVSSFASDENYKKFIESNTPLVLVDRSFKNTSLPYVIGDDKQTTIDLLNSLKNKDIEKLAYLGGKKGLSTTNIRDNAVKEWALKTKVDVLTFNLGYKVLDGYNLAKELVQKHKDVDSILCGSFSILEGVLIFFKENKIDYNSYNIATFGDNSLLDILNTNIISARQDYLKIAQITFGLLLNIKETNNQIILSREIITR